jgi:hypothetical protein
LFPIGILGSNETLHGPEGIFLIAWMTGVGLAVVGSVAAGGQVIILYRFTQYMMEPWAIFIGFGAVWLLSLISKGYPVKSASSVQSRPHRALPVAVIITILIISAGALAYPPKSAMSGFQEGITEEEMIGVIWSDNNIESGAAVATDHRLSSMLFGFAGLNASWDYVELVFTEDNFADARDELNCSGLPSGRKRIDYVMLSDELKSGVALVQWEQAEPISDASLEKFSQNPFYTIYDTGEVQIYFIDWKYDPGGKECKRE